MHGFDDVLVVVVDAVVDSVVTVDSGVHSPVGYVGSK